MVVRGSAWEAASWTSRSGTPASKLVGDERVAQRVRPDGLGQSGAAGGAADDPGGAVPVQPVPGSGEEDRPFASFADGQVDRACGARRERDDGQGAVAALDGQGLDVRADGLGNAQPVEGMLGIPRSQQR